MPPSCEGRYLRSKTASLNLPEPIRAVVADCKPIVLVRKLLAYDKLSSDYPYVPRYTDSTSLSLSLDSRWSLIVAY